MSVHIIHCGSQSPLGTWTSMSAANIRAGLARITVYPNYEDSQWSPVKVALAEYLNPNISNKLRFLKLGLNALKETLVPIKEVTIQPGPIPLLIGIPGKRDGLHERIESKFKERLLDLEQSYSFNFLPEFYPNDHAAGLIAIKEAIRRLETDQVEFCVAGGVESYINSDSLAWLEKKGHLRCTDNKWGMIPGEAAGFCLLTTLETAKKYQLASSARILAVANAAEADIQEEVCLGNALTQALQQVLAALPEGEKVDQVFCDLNGQRYRADEYGYSMLRLNRYFENPRDLVAPANLWGDLGAASAPLLTGLATESGRKGYAKGPNNLIVTMSPTGIRAAALIRLNET